MASEFVKNLKYMVRMDMRSLSFPFRAMWRLFKSIVMMFFFFISSEDDLEKFQVKARKKKDLAAYDKILSPAVKKYIDDIMEMSDPDREYELSVLKGGPGVQEIVLAEVARRTKHDR